MAKWLIIFLLSFCLLGCKQKRPPGTTSGPAAIGQPPAEPPKVGAPSGGQPAPGQQPPPPPGHQPPDDKAPKVKHSDKDGSTLDKLLAGATSLRAGGPPGNVSGTATVVTDAKVVQAVLAALNLKQTARGGFKPCNLHSGFEVRDAQGKELAFITVCEPIASGEAGRGSVSSKHQKLEWAISFPDGFALASLLVKHLPRAVQKTGTSTP